MNIDYKKYLKAGNASDGVLSVTASCPEFSDETFPHRVKITPGKVKEWLREQGHVVGACLTDITLNNRVLGANEKTWIFECGAKASSKIVEKPSKPKSHKASKAKIKKTREV